jgi:hypothetical protein
MQSRFTALGITNDDKAVILAYELKENEFKVDLYIVPRKSLSNEQIEKLEKEWVEGSSFDFPEDTLFVNPNLNAESILPADIRSEETGKIRIKQNEWAYRLLTAKLWESYLLELEELKKKAEALTQYDRQLFDDAKSFWERVLEHRKERDISQEGLDKIKDDVNSIFEKLKTFRKTESAEFEAASAKLRDEISAKLENLRNRADSKANFKELLEELKTIQQESRKNRYTKADDQQLRKAFDTTFQYINAQRNSFFSDKTASRIKGLQEVIQKMEQSLARDKKDLEYYTKKAESSNIKSLELQLIKVKTNLLNETITSKEEKLKDIYATLEKLQRQAARAEQKNDLETSVNDETEVTPAREVAPADEPNPSVEE